MNTMLEKAIIFATERHAGQLDKVGEPYILHPLRVMMCVQGVEARTVAMLHDVLEDTKTYEWELLDVFAPSVIEAVVALTKVGGQNYNTYLEQVARNPIAKIVKIADIKDNVSPSRLYKLDPETIVRLTKKYSHALRKLELNI